MLKIKSFLTILLVAISLIAYSQRVVSISSWNLKDFGKSKSQNQIEVIANTVKVFDVIAIQEVVAGYGGAQAVARLHDALNRKGSTWDYVISEPTSGSPHSSERYAFIWKTSVLSKIGDAWLDKKFSTKIDREPFLIKLSFKGNIFTLLNFHAVPKSKQPEREIKFFRSFPEYYRNHNLIFLGDFNLPQSHTVFNPLKSMGYVSALKGQKTSLRQKCLNNDCLASEFDNIFFKSATFRMHARGIVPFHQKFTELKQARAISDHVPVFVRLSFIEN